MSQVAESDIDLDVVRREENPVALVRVEKPNGRVTVGLGVSEMRLAALLDKHRSCALHMYWHHLGLGPLNDVFLVCGQGENQVRRWADPSSRFPLDTPHNVVSVSFGSVPLPPEPIRREFSQRLQQDFLARAEKSDTAAERAHWQGAALVVELILGMCY